ncbi:MAG: 3-hydroxyacyl-ACP dehydratase FabZ [Thermodesulfobacteriota bacterium]
MADYSEEIYKRIPHRPPFLWVDRIIEFTENSILTEKHIPEDLDVFAGHYPDHPLMPGVLLCEAIFQSGALLISKLNESSSPDDKKIPVLTRIINAKFRKEVKPGDLAAISVKFKEQVGPAMFMKGSLKVDGKTAVQVEFACALVEG